MSNPARRDPPAYGVPTLAGLDRLTRRRLIGAGGLLLAFAAVSSRRPAHAAGEEPSLHVIQRESGNPHPGYSGFAPGGFIRIPPTGPIVFILPNVEMGQGIYTGEAQLIAEELEVGLDQVTIEAAPPDETLYTQPLLQSQATGGSTSIRGAFVPLRQAGAAARTMLIGAAAAQWNVTPGECVARRGIVRHDPTGRMLSYGALSEAASKQPVPKDVPLKNPKDYQLIGKPVPRVDQKAKVDGSAVYGIDVRLPGMKIASVRACPVFGGTLADVDDRPARAVPGVIDVVRLSNAVAVIGDHFWAAEQGIRALDIRWNEGPNATLTSAALVAAMRNQVQHTPPVLGRALGDADAAFKQAARRVDAVYELPFLAHATMEPINALVHVRPDACEVWVGTQVPVRAQQQAAEGSGLPPDKVIIHNHLLGGGFGRRLEASFVRQAAEIARHVPYPVKVIWTREEDIRQDLYRPAYYDRVSAGLGDDGMPLVWTDRITGGSVMATWQPSGMTSQHLDPDAVEGAAEPPYDFPALHVDWVRAEPPLPLMWWRGVGPTHNVFVLESFMDELAHAAGKDPIDYRLALLGKNPRAANVLRIARQRSGWGGPLPAETARGVSLHDSFGSYVAAVVEITVLRTGEIRFRRITGVIDCGLAVNPDSVAAQLEGGLIFGLTAALYNEITFDAGRVQQSNFNNYRMMRMNETPPTDIIVVQSTETVGGVGETGTVSAAPALGNAIFAATGKRLRRYPFLKEQLVGPDDNQGVVSMAAPEERGGAELAELAPAAQLWPLQAGDAAERQ